MLLVLLAGLSASSANCISLSVWAKSKIIIITVSIEAVGPSILFLLLNYSDKSCKE